MTNDLFPLWFVPSPSMAAREFLLCGFRVWLPAISAGGLAKQLSCIDLIDLAEGVVGHDDRPIADGVIATAPVPLAVADDIARSGHDFNFSTLLVADVRTRLHCGYAANRPSDNAGDPGLTVAPRIVGIVADAYPLRHCFDDFHCSLPCNYCSYSAGRCAI